jgi:hypothetical protein
MKPMGAPEDERVLDPISVRARGGEAGWWGEGLAVIKATGADTGGRSRSARSPSRPAPRPRDTYITWRTRVLGPGGRRDLRRRQHDDRRDAGRLVRAESNIRRFIAPQARDPGWSGMRGSERGCSVPSTVSRCTSSSRPGRGDQRPCRSSLVKEQRRRRSDIRRDLAGMGTLLVCTEERYEIRAVAADGERAGHLFRRGYLPPKRCFRGQTPNNRVQSVGT